MSTTDRTFSPLPTWYIPHGGGPCFFMDWSPIGPADTWDRMGTWLKGVGASLPFLPRAVLVISAHWEEPEFTILTDTQPALLFDYSGFPESTYTLTYPALGSPELTAELESRLSAAKLKVKKKFGRGLDHGVFIPFKLIFPNADIPIVQLSLKTGLNPHEHLRLGEVLSSLRSQGVLIVGSGMSYHNLRGFFSGRGDGISEPFDAWLTETLTVVNPTERRHRLERWDHTPGARQAHPREEHLLPLMVAVGAAGNDPGTRDFTDVVMGHRVSAFRFG